jgi:hypothetical protein
MAGMFDRNNHTGWSLVIGLALSAIAGFFTWLAGRGNAPRGEDQTISIFKKPDNE